MKKHLLSSVFAALWAVSVCRADAAPSRLDVQPDQINGQYRVGQKINIGITLHGTNDQIIADADLFYSMTLLGDTQEGIVKSSLLPVNVSYNASVPGFVHFQVTSAVPAAVKQQLYVVVEPEKTRPQTPCPADFASFWAKQKARLNEVPINPVVRAVEITQDYLKKSVVAFDIKLDCVGEIPVTAYLAIPQARAGEARFPLLVTFHGHSYFPRSGSHLRLNEAVLQRMITFDVNPHGLPNGLPIEYYKEKVWPIMRGKQGPYPYRDWEDLEAVYFNGMFLRIVRALEYAKTRPEWDGKNLIVEGSSMGASQALVAAGLDPDVTICVANVPAMADQLGAIPGWPRLLGNAKTDPALLRKNAPYYDMVNFALQSKAKTLVGVGLRDMVCPAPSVWAVYNNLSGSKKIVVSPEGVHNWNQEMRDAKQPWIQAGVQMISEKTTPPLK